MKKEKLSNPNYFKNNDRFIRNVNLQNFIKQKSSKNQKLTNISPTEFEYINILSLLKEYEDYILYITVVGQETFETRFTSSPDNVILLITKIKAAISLIELNVFGNYNKIILHVNPNELSIWLTSNDFNSGVIVFYNNKIKES